MATIAENDYNLNISHYISSAEPEVQIDLGAINTQLLALEEKIQAATSRHNAFLAPLGLPRLTGCWRNSLRSEGLHDSCGGLAWRVGLRYDAAN